ARPTPGQVRADVQTMVDFGPRLTGNDAHNRYIAWLEQEFEAAGCSLLPCDVYETSRWEVGTFGLDVLDGPGAGPAKVATYFPRSKETPPTGVTGPLVYGGTAPQPSFNAVDAASIQAGLERYPADLASWARALPGTRPKARLTLSATRTTVPTPAVTAILPGASDETIIFNTHTDGQGFVEENGGVAFVHLARHFASRRPRRTLVFAAWPGHMS